MAYFHTTVLDNQIKALPTVSTASGSVATFDTDMTENLVSCVCEVASGASEINVYATNENLWVLDTNSIGLNYNGNVNVKRYNQTFKVPEGEYTFSRNANADDFTELFVGVATRPIGAGFDISNDSSRKNLKLSNVQTVTVDSTYPYLFVNAIAVAETMTESIMNGVQLQAEFGSMASTYKQSNGSINNIPFGETLSGDGSFDVLSGILIRSDDTTKQLSANYIQTKNGINNIWCDTGDTEVKFLLTVGKAIS